MKILRNIICLLLALSAAYGFSSGQSATGTVIVEFNDINPDCGMVEASIYNRSETFLVKDQFIQRKRSNIVNGKAQIIFENIPLGKIALGSYHDVDSDEEYDKNWIGLPAEPYAFSKPPVNNWRKPRFEEVAVDFNRSGQVFKLTFQTFMP